MDHPPDPARALRQIAAIHDHLARGEVYRGWRPVPVAGSGLVGLAAAWWQAAAGSPIEPWSFTSYWLATATLAMAVGCAEIVWHYVFEATATERRRTHRVLAQFLPGLVAGAAATGALLRLSPAHAELLPGLWALLFGVAIFAARPYVPRGSGWVALYYWAAGLLLLWTADGVHVLSPWTVGATFGVGQLLAALALYWSRERRSVDDDEET